MFGILNAVNLIKFIEYYINPQRFNILYGYCKIMSLQIVHRLKIILFYYYYFYHRHSQRCGYLLLQY